MFSLRIVKQACLHHLSFAVLMAGTSAIYDVMGIDTTQILRCPGVSPICKSCPCHTRMKQRVRNFSLIGTVDQGRGIKDSKKQELRKLTLGDPEVGC